ncbi:MAG: P27 family phage terminase small subunit [Saprospiraceae bacterium]|nr:P27 family phage terminase small subunit [Saprospiraceae bacterium]
MPTKKPNEVKRHAGTYRRDRDKVADLVLTPTNEVPPPYTSLSERQTELYYLAANYAKASMPLLQIDSFVLVQLAIALELAEQAKDGIREKGAIQVYTKTQARAVSPEVQLYEKAVLMIAKLGALFGFSPKDRVALLGSMTPKPKQYDPLEFGL